MRAKAGKQPASLHHIISEKAGSLQFKMEDISFVPENTPISESCFELYDLFTYLSIYVHKKPFVFCLHQQQSLLFNNTYRNICRYEAVISSATGLSVTAVHVFAILLHCFSSIMTVLVSHCFPQAVSSSTTRHGQQLLPRVALPFVASLPHTISNFPLSATPSYSRSQKTYRFF